MNDYYIIYKCNVCGCKFGVESSYIKHAEEEYIYLTCPLNGKHKSINVVNTMELKRIMEERKAVLL